MEPTLDDFYELVTRFKQNPSDPELAQHISIGIGFLLGQRMYECAAALLVLSEPDYPEITQRIIPHP